MENLFENQDIININIEDSVKASYLDYSMSVIIGRALPDAKRWFKTSSQKNFICNARFKYYFKVCL